MDDVAAIFLDVVKKSFFIGFKQIFPVCVDSGLFGLTHDWAFESRALVPRF
jgi:hypothetical protein